jgi:large subunit ribosomal protein L9
MQIILIKDVDNLGASGELVEVRPGYARNYLIPTKYAIEASGSNMKIMQERQKQLAKREAKLMAEINKVREVLKASPVTIGAKVGTSGKIFGSVTAIQLARAIREQKGYEIDRRRISIIDDVKEAGIFKAQIDFGKENIVEMEFEVVGEQATV